MRKQTIVGAMLIAQLVIIYLVRAGYTELSNTTIMHEDLVLTLLVVTWFIVAAIEDSNNV